MPIELPNLDDRNFADLVEEGKRLIPGSAPSWTDHNTSDPGITFIELFASVAEMLIYRVNRVSEANKRAFVKLLAPDWTPESGLTISQVINGLRVEERAVTAQDFERLALLSAHTGINRIHCLPRRNLESGNPRAHSEEALGHVSLISVFESNVAPPDRDAILAKVKAHVQERCLLTTMLHVVKPAILMVAANLTLYIYPDQLEADVKQRALDTLKDHFSPLNRPLEGKKGWPFGAPIYRSDIYALMDKVDGVDYGDLSAEKDDIFVVAPTPNDDRKIKLPGRNYIGLRLEANELVSFSVKDSTIACNVRKTTISG
jgi:hypothetical protein